MVKSAMSYNTYMIEVEVFVLADEALKGVVDQKDKLLALTGRQP
jgi:hypothetical protein